MNTSFENSSMKNSFSMTSLGMSNSNNGSTPSNGPTTYDTTTERPYHSLNKKRKDPSRETWRRSWSSAVSNGSTNNDDLWPVLQQDYDFIMDKQIIETCREANGELSSGNLAFVQSSASSGFNRQWSLSQMIKEFQDMCHWLTAIQSDIYSSPENLSNRNLRASRMSELTKATPNFEKFLEQASAILERMPEARDEVSWRVEHLSGKWESVRLTLTPETDEGVTIDTDDTEKNFDAAHELKCLRRWLHTMEGRLPPPAINRSWSQLELSRKLREHQVLQRDVECHGRIVNSVVRLCGTEAARALERRWHLLYLRAIEWQCHLEACVSRLEDKDSIQNQLIESDDEPALKQPRLTKKESEYSCFAQLESSQLALFQSNDESCSDDVASSRENPDDLRWNGFYTDTSDFDSVTMDVDYQASERHVPIIQQKTPTKDAPSLIECIDNRDLVDGLENVKSHEISFYDDETTMKTPPTIVRRRKQHDSSKFNQSDRKSKHMATFYYKHPDTDSDMKANEKSHDSSEDSRDNTMEEDLMDAMKSPIDLNEIDNRFLEECVEMPENDVVTTLKTPDLIKTQKKRCNEDIERLVLEAEVLVQKKAQQQMIASVNTVKSTRNFKPLLLNDPGKSVTSQAKVSRIKEWLRQNPNGDEDQCMDSYDASGEYTTESEVDKQSATSEENTASVTTYRNVNSSMEMSSYTVTPASNNTPVHAKVTLRKKRNSGPRPWSVSCISQFVNAAESRTNMSISESALNEISAETQDTPVTETSSSVKTTVQGHISSTTTINEACTSCVDTADTRTSTIRRKKSKLRRRHLDLAEEINVKGVVKSSSFSGQILAERDDKIERNAASDPATSRVNRCETSSTSDNDSEDCFPKQQLESITSLRRSIERTHISSQHEQAMLEQIEEILPTPSFKIGPAGGPVRPRLTHSCERERNLHGLQLTHQDELWELTGEKDSEKESGTAGTEEHSSFSEQAWDFYQEKYNSEPYSEAPDSDAARRLLEFGDDYRAFLDSQSDNCSSLSAHPDGDSPRGARKFKRGPPENKKTRKSVSSAERKKSLLDSLERARNNHETEMRRRKLTYESSKGCRSFDSGRRLTDSSITESEVNSSLEYTSASKPDIIDSARPKRKVSTSDRSESAKPLKGQDSDLSEDVRALLRKSSSQLDSTEMLLATRQASPDVLLCTDYTDIIATCIENIRCLENILSGAGYGIGSSFLSPTKCRDVRALAARWSTLRSAAMRRGNARRLRRDLAALKDSLAEICDGDHGAPLMHSKNEVVRRIEILKDRLSRLLDYKVSLLKLQVTVRRVLSELETEDIDSSLAVQLSSDLEALYKAWDDAHQTTSTELLTLEKALTAWTEWESGLRELQNCLREDEATLQLLEKAMEGGVDRSHFDSHLSDIANLLADKKKLGSDGSGSLSDSGISDGDSETGSTRVKRLNALRNLARALHHTLAPGSHALRLVAKRMEQAEKELRHLQESCHALVSKTAQNAVAALEKTIIHTDTTSINANSENGPAVSGSTARWLWRVLKSALPFQLCFLALICAAYLLDRPRCCDRMNNNVAGFFSPQLRYYYNGSPPI